MLSFEGDTRERVTFGYPGANKSYTGIFKGNKGIILPYPSGNLILELILLLFTSVVEAVRNFMGQKGNLTEQADSILISLALTIPLVFGFLYFLSWQTYVLRIEVITNAIQLTLLAFETLFALITVASLAKYGNFTIRR